MRTHAVVDSLFYSLALFRNKIFFFEFSVPDLAASQAAATSPTAAQLLAQKV
jgi:hypothetical protein